MVYPRFHALLHGSINSFHDFANLSAWRCRFFLCFSWHNHRPDWPCQGACGLNPKVRCLQVQQPKAQQPPLSTRPSHFGMHMSDLGMQRQSQPEIYCMRKWHAVWQSLHHENCHLVNEHICRKYPFPIGSASYVRLEECFHDLRISRNCCCSWCQASMVIQLWSKSQNGYSRPGASHMGHNGHKSALWDPKMRPVGQVIPTVDRTKKGSRIHNLLYQGSRIQAVDFPQASVKSFGRSNCLTPDKRP